jgi:hypothetical protein
MKKKKKMNQINKKERDECWVGGILTVRYVFLFSAQSVFWLNMNIQTKKGGKRKLKKGNKLQNNSLSEQKQIDIQ